MNARKQSERLINPLRFLFSYARSTICKEKIVGLWTAYNSGSGPKSSPPQRTLCRRGDDLEYPATVTASSEERGFLLEFELHLELMLNWSFNLFFFHCLLSLKDSRGKEGFRRRKFWEQNSAIGQPPKPGKSALGTRLAIGVTASRPIQT